MIEWLQEKASVLFSPIFWGWTLAAIVKIGIASGWWDTAVSEVLFEWIALVTGTGTVLKFGTKVSGK